MFGQIGTGTYLGTNREVSGSLFGDQGLYCKTDLA